MILELSEESMKKIYIWHAHDSWSWLVKYMSNDLDPVQIEKTQIKQTL